MTIASTSNDTHSDRTAVVIDVSNSTRGSSSRRTGGIVPNYAAAVGDAMTDAVGRRDTVAIGSFSGTASDVSWAVKDRSTDWKSGVSNPANQQERRKDAVNCLRKSGAKAAAASPDTPGTDILGAMSVAAGWLGGGHGAKRLVIFTDGVPTTGCADLTRVSMRGDVELKGLVRSCGRSKELRPGDLRGIDVSIFGVGNSGPGYPLADAAHRDWLRKLWQSLCADGGTASSCEVKTDPLSADLDAVAGRPDGAVPDPVVPLAGKVTIYRLPGGVLFDGDSDTLRREAKPYLQRIAGETRTAQSVQVNGYAAPLVSASVGLTLSWHRAQSVGRFLDGLGVPVTAMQGLGVTNVCPDPGLAHRYGRDGQPYECYRRVDIVVTDS